MGFRQQVGRLDYLTRHARLMLPYMTPRKFVNAALNLLELQFKVTSPRSYPPYIKLEPTRLCHLRCPGCGHADPGFKAAIPPRSRLSLDELKKVIDPLADHLIAVSLSNRGEPLMNRDLAALVSYCHSRRIGVNFPSNFSLRWSEAAFEELVRSGVDAIFVSLDGASAETYEQYRIGGNFDLVLKNVATVSAIKRRLGLKSPRLVWKFVIFDHNRHEIPIVRRTYRELGFDAFEFVEDYHGKKVQSSRKKHKSTIGPDGKGCFWAWNTMIIDWNGDVSPCCRHIDFGLGNAVVDGPVGVWRSDAYQALRQGFTGERPLHDKCAVCLGVAKPSVTEAHREQERIIAVDLTPV